MYWSAGILNPHFQTKTNRRSSTSFPLANDTPKSCYKQNENEVIKLSGRNIDVV